MLADFTNSKFFTFFLNFHAGFEFFCAMCNQCAPTVRLTWPEHGLTLVQNVLRTCSGPPCSERSKNMEAPIGFGTVRTVGPTLAQPTTQTVTGFDGSYRLGRLRFTLK